MDLDLIFHEITQELERTGGQFSAGYTSQGADGLARWEIRITHGNPGGRETTENVAVGPTFIDALEKAFQQFKRG